MVVFVNKNLTYKQILPTYWFSDLSQPIRGAEFFNDLRFFYAIRSDLRCPQLSQYQDIYVYKLVLFELYLHLKTAKFKLRNIYCLYNYTRETVY